MPIPSQDRLEVPLLRAIEAAGGRLSRKDAISNLPKYIDGLTQQDLARFPASGNRRVWDTRVMWTSTGLVKKGEIDKSTRGIWAITAAGRNRLLAAGVSSMVSGTGTSIISRPQVAALETSLVKSEDELYKPLCEWLDKNWGDESRAENSEYWVKVTASQSRKGKWSRPDLVSVEISRFEMLPRKEIEVTTFEVKRESDALDLASVYEAASHQRWGHYAYLVIERASQSSLTAKLPYDPSYLAELARFGVGLLVMSKSASKGDYEVEVVGNPERQNPDPKELDRMLGDFFSGNQREASRFKETAR